MPAITTPGPVAATLACHGNGTCNEGLSADPYCGWLEFCYCARP